MLTQSNRSFLVAAALFVALFVGGMAVAPLLGLPQALAGIALAVLGVRVGVMVTAVREPVEAPPAAAASRHAPRLRAA